MFLLIVEMIKLKYIPDQCNLPLNKKIKNVKLDIKDFNLNYDLIKENFLDNKSKFALFLLKNKFILLFYILNKLNYKIKKIKNYK